MPKTPVEYKKLYRTCTIKLFDISLTFYLNLCLTFCVSLLPNPEANLSTKSGTISRTLVSPVPDSWHWRLWNSSILGWPGRHLGQFTGHSTAAVALLVTLESPCSYAEGNIHQRKDDRITNMDRITHYCFCCDKTVHPLKQGLYCCMKTVVCHNKNLPFSFSLLKKFLYKIPDITLL